MRMLLPLVASVAVIVPAQPTAPVAAALAESASRWAAGLEQELSGLLFRERYDQAADVGFSHGHSLGSSRNEIRLEANVFLLRAAGRDQFVVYRDVYRVNGRDVADHTERLQQLLTAPTADTLAQAQRLTDASARFNVGQINRNVNIPTMAFEYLTPKNISRLDLREEGRATIDGVNVTVVTFEEKARPTLVRGEGGSDVAARGRYWIDPMTGAVPRALVEFTGDDGFTGRMEIHLVRHAALDTWVPAEMTETWTSATSNASGVARYDRFQRLSVSTGEIVK